MIAPPGGAHFQVPRRLREAIRDPLPRLIPRAAGHVGGRRIPEAALPDGRRPGGGDGADPAAQAGGGERLPLVAGRLRDGLRLLRDGADAAASQPGDLGDGRPVRAGAGAGRVAGAAGHRRGLHGDGRAVPELRPGDGGGRAAAVPVRRGRSAPRRSRSARWAWSPRSTASRPRSGAFRLSISLGAATDEKRARAGARRRPDAGRRGDGRRPPPRPRSSRRGSCCRMSASRASTCPRTTPAPWAT